MAPFLCRLAGWSFRWRFPLRFAAAPSGSAQAGLVPGLLVGDHPSVLRDARPLSKEQPTEKRRWFKWGLATKDKFGDVYPRAIKHKGPEAY